MNGKILCAYSLFSSSKGNCTYIKYGDSAILIDAGASARGIAASLLQIGADINEIKAVFITHEHSDHIKGVGTLQKKYGIPVHAVDKCAEKMIELGLDASKIVFHDPIFCERVGDIEISSFKTPHDSVCSVGYIIKCGDIKLAVATDMGIITDEADKAICGCDYVLIESNHDRDMLIFGEYPYILKQRILSSRGHLSNDDCAKEVCKIIKCGAKRIVLGHLSENNNTPQKAYDCTKALIEKENLSGTFTLDVASPYSPVDLISGQ